MVIAAVLIIGRTFIAKLFTDDKDVIKMFGEVAPYVGLVMVFDGLQIAGAGALRGLGRQHLGMLFNFMAFYLVGVPLGALLVFVAKIDLPGLWLGLAASDSFSAVLFTVCLCCINWTKASNKIASEEEMAAAKNAATGGSTHALAQQSGSYRRLLGKESGVNEYAATRVAAASVSSVRSLRHVKFVPEELTDSGDDSGDGDDDDDKQEDDEPLDTTAIND